MAKSYVHGWIVKAFVKLVKTENQAFEAIYKRQILEQIYSSKNIDKI